MKKFDEIPAGIKCNWHQPGKDPATCKWYGKDGYCGQEPGPVQCETGGRDT